MITYNNKPNRPNFIIKSFEELYNDYPTQNAIKQHYYAFCEARNKLRISGFFIGFYHDLKNDISKNYTLHHINAIDPVQAKKISNINNNQKKGGITEEDKYNPINYIDNLTMLNHFEHYYVHKLICLSRVLEVDDGLRGGVWFLMYELYKRNADRVFLAGEIIDFAKVIKLNHKLETSAEVVKKLNSYAKLSSLKEEFRTQYNEWIEFLNNVLNKNMETILNY